MDFIDLWWALQLPRPLCGPSASYTRAVTDRERLRKLADTLPQDVSAEALALISDLVQRHDAQLSEDELMALDEADAAIAAGEVRPLSEARPDLDL